jgi:hypothetical protein
MSLVKARRMTMPPDPMRPPAGLNEVEQTLWDSFLQFNDDLGEADAALMLLAAKIGARLRVDPLNVRAAEDYASLALMLRVTGTAKNLERRAVALLSSVTASARAAPSPRRFASHQQGHIQ